MRRFFALLLVLLVILVGCRKPIAVNVEKPADLEPNVEVTVPEEPVKPDEKEVVEPVKPEPLEEPGEFILADFVFGILTYQDLAVDIEEKLGAPERQEEDYDDLLGDNYLTYFYPGFEIRLEKWEEDFQIQHVTVTHGDISGPRGIEVGMTTEQVLSEFPNYNLPQDAEQVLYGQPMSGNRGAAYWQDNDLTSIYYVYEPDGWVPTVFRLTFENNRVVKYELYFAFN